MKKIIGVIFVTLSVVACKKDNDTEVIPVNDAPKYKIVDFKSKPETYSSDQYGRQVKVIAFDGSRVETAYSKGKVTRTEYDASGVVYRTIVSELNADGLMAKTWFKDDPGVYTVYEYTADNRYRLVTSVNALGTTVTTYHYSNGNLDSTRSSLNGAWYLTNVYEYYHDQPCVQQPANSGTLYNAKSSDFMYRSLTHNFANGTSIKSEFVYEYNAQGLVSKLTEVSPNGTTTGYYTYY
jgi:hypothetical protein